MQIGYQHLALTETNIIITGFIIHGREEANAHLLAHIQSPGLYYIYIGNHGLARCRDFRTVAAPNCCILWGICTELGTDHGALEGQRCPVCTAQVNISENNVVGIGGVFLIRCLVDIQIGVYLARCLIDTATTATDE